MNVDPLTPRQKALLLGLPCIAGLLGALAWAIVAEIRGRMDFRT